MQCFPVAYAITIATAFLFLVNAASLPRVHDASGLNAYDLSIKDETSVIEERDLWATCFSAIICSGIAHNIGLGPFSNCSSVQAHQTLRICDTCDEDPSTCGSHGSGDCSSYTYGCIFKGW